MNAFLAQLYGFFNAVIGFLIVAFGVWVGITLVTDHEIMGFSMQQAAPTAIATVIVANCVRSVTLLPGGVTS